MTPSDVTYRRRAERRATKAANRAWFAALKTGKSCSCCGQSFPPQLLDYHHVDPATKRFRLAHAVRNGYGKAVILAEIAKCVLLCANCHRAEHIA